MSGKNWDQDEYIVNVQERCFFNDPEMGLFFHYKNRRLLLSETEY